MVQRLRVEGHPHVIGLHDDALPQQHLAFLGGALALHRHEVRKTVGAAEQARTVTVEGDRAGCAAHRERNDEPALLREPVDPRRGDVPRRRGDDDPVVGRSVGDAPLAIGEDRLHLPVSGLVQAQAGTVDDVAVDVDRGDLTVAAHEFLEVGGIDAARADLQDLHPGRDVGLLQHHTLKVGGGHDADVQVALVFLDRHNPVEIVNDLQGRLRREPVPGHGGEGRSNRVGRDRVLVTERADHLRTPRAGIAIGRVIDNRHPVTYFC